MRLAESMFETHVREKTTMVKVRQVESGRVCNAFSAGNETVIASALRWNLRFVVSSSPCSETFVAQSAGTSCPTRRLLEPT